MFATDLELVIDGHILLPVIVSHDDYQLVRLVVGQSVKGIKTNPTLAWKEVSVYSLDFGYFLISPLASNPA